MLKFTETVEIINSEYSIEIYGYDPNWMDIPATLITHQQFQSTKVPFTVKIKIPKNAADSIEHINNKANAKYYLNIEWDSDGNGKKCNGDISIDFNTKFPEISLESNEKQIIFLKKLTSSTPCI